jgi:hypothetical protein
MNLIVLGFFEDMSFLLKLAFIIFIIIFVRERITKNWLAITAIVIFCLLLVFKYWHIFGSIYVVYILITIGIGGVLVDTFFVTMQEGQPKHKGGGPSPQQMLGAQEQEFDMEEMAGARQQLMRQMGGRR